MVGKDKLGDEKDIHKNNIKIFVEVFAAIQWIFILFFVSYELSVHCRTKRIKGNFMNPVP